MELRYLPQTEVRDRAPEIWRVYDAVFGDQPSYDEWLSGMLLRHAARDRFRFAAALDGDDLVGIAWGYVGASGQYYTDSVRAAIGDEAADRWQPAFEIVELGLLPEHRGSGNGRALLRLLVEGIDGPMMLSTWDDDEDPAVRLYLSEGWRRIGEHPKADGSRTMQIMGHA
jgi:GNAT superfamily N-acetyltransferase